MPVHDWTRVDSGIFHAFHQGWLTHLSETLNDGLLPADYYALPDQVAGGIGPDVLTLEVSGNGPRPASGNGSTAGPAAGGTGVLTAPPQVRYTAALSEDAYVRRRRTITIRHTSDDRIVALIEVISPGNKASAYTMQVLLDKVASALQQGVHVLLIDLHPPTPRDPRGLHSAVWEHIGGPPFDPPAGEPLTLASYVGTSGPRCYVEPTAVGRALPDMPLFLMPDGHVSVPLERTYMQTWRGIPARWRAVVDPTQGAG